MKPGAYDNRIDRIADALERIAKALEILTKHGIRTWEGVGRVED
ncbi:hypothetical protein LCGC14_2751310 [marine sediment metagenome]|uniref:Uncharacterized protein n=1 Tax=marine sediment metagenome TaxID=412755 RepID=A0A0F8Z1T7_9ZZZZ